MYILFGINKAGKVKIHNSLRLEVMFFVFESINLGIKWLFAVKNRIKRVGMQEKEPKSINRGKRESYEFSFGQSIHSDLWRDRW